MGRPVPEHEPDDFCPVCGGPEVNGRIRHTATCPLRNDDEPGDFPVYDPPDEFTSNG